jgi:YbbR domain-containing protein
MIRITLRGDANTIYPIMEEDVQAYIDLNRYTEPGTYRAPVQIRKSGTAVRAETLEIAMDPLEVVLLLDERLSKTVSVTVNFRGALEPGYELAGYTLEPSQIVVDGPRGLLTDITEITTDFIELAGRSSDFSSTVRIMNEEPLLIIRGNGFIEFHGTVREQLRIQSFEGLPIRIDRLDDRFSGVLEIARGSIRIEGGQMMLGKIGDQDIGLSVDCSSINSEGDFLLPVSVFFPAMFTLLQQDPENVLVRIQRKQPRDDGGGES